jgi:predicted RNA-binding Zn-ribbon protein involved in translation (DUF1610 family)
MSDIEREYGMGKCPKCGNEFEWVDVVQHGFIDHDDVTGYCDKCGEAIAFVERGNLNFLKGLSYSKKR